MNASPKSHFLDASVVHYEWNNAIAPRLTIDPGDTVVFETRDASDEFYSPDCDVSNPCTRDSCDPAHGCRHDHISGCH